MKKFWRVLACMVFPAIVVAGLIAAIAVPLSKMDAPNRPVQGPQIEYAGATINTGAASADKSKKGGAIFLEPNTQYTMTGGTISGKKNTYGGAVFISSGATFIMTSGTISGCSATYGGGIYVAAGGTCIIRAGTITGCTASYGPAIFVEVGGTLNLSSSASVNKNDVLQDTAKPTYDLNVHIGDFGGDGRTPNCCIVEFGTYPKTYVGDTMNATLESWYSAQKPEPVKTYTGQTGTWPAYSYIDGDIYARGSARRSGDASIYQDGTAVVNGQITWFKVKPITWFALNYEEWIPGGKKVNLELYSELVIAAEQFNGRISGSWESSDIRNWCNDTFFKEAFDASEQEMIKNTTIGNNVAGDYDDSSGTATIDKIYLRSYYEMQAFPFISQEEMIDEYRIASGSDFAIANNLACDQSHSTYYISTSAMYWLRSVGAADSAACYIGYNGAIINNNGFTAFFNIGVRPGMHINF